MYGHVCKYERAGQRRLKDSSCACIRQALAADATGGCGVWIFPQPFLNTVPPGVARAVSAAKQGTVLSLPPPDRSHTCPHPVHTLFTPLRAPHAQGFPYDIHKLRVVARVPSAAKQGIVGIRAVQETKITPRAPDLGLQVWMRCVDMTPGPPHGDARLPACPSTCSHTCCPAPPALWPLCVTLTHVRRLPPHSFPHSSSRFQHVTGVARPPPDLLCPHAAGALILHASHTSHTLQDWLVLRQRCYNCTLPPPTLFHASHTSHTLQDWLVLRQRCYVRTLAPGTKWYLRSENFPEFTSPMDPDLGTVRLKNPQH
eukprot:59434-Chlamydomonas_euryale.AAC.2